MCTLAPHARFLPALHAFVVCCIAFTAAVITSAADRPNVIILLTDDQGFGDLSCHGNPQLKTPNLDRLHRESVRFVDFHSAPMCTPTRAQLMTGMDAMRTGAYNVSSGRALLSREFPTAAEVFGTNGYRTAIFGKWHLGDNYPYRPQDRGFQESIWFPSSHISSAPDHFNNDYFDDVYEHNGKRRPFEGYCTDVFFREARDWMAQRAADQEPFFLYLPLNAPHGPLFVPDKYREPYRHLAPRLASFYAMIANIDENVGQLEEFLRRSGLRENTILIFMTDNGTATGETVYNAGMRGKKVALYEGGHRVPCFVRWPAGKLRAGADISGVTRVQDILPTLIELCQLKHTPSRPFDGTSLGGVLRRENEHVPDRMLVTQYTRLNASRPKKDDALVMWKRWRLVANTELYDLSRDQGQERNVIAEHPNVAALMREHHERWWAEIVPRVFDFLPVHIGAPQENPTLLSPCEWQDVFVDQQAQVRRQKRNGVWTLFVERDGNYQFALRRWARETDAAITAAMPAHHGVDGVYAAGDAFPVARAEIKIGADTQAKAVAADDREVTFTIHLNAAARNCRPGSVIRAAVRSRERIMCTSMGPERRSERAAGGTIQLSDER
jgi:arylsulfatase A-like enzyme